MKVLIALHNDKNYSLTSIDEVLKGEASCAGSTGAAIRLAELLFDRGIEVYIAYSIKLISHKIPFVLYEDVVTEHFDRLIVLHTHWDGTKLTFGNEVLSKTILFAQNHLSLVSTYNFFKGGGHKIVSISYYHANISRALPLWRNRIAAIYNSYCPLFHPERADKVKTSTQHSEPKLLFVGAITPSKGFIELMELWSYLSSKKVNLKLAIAGSIGLHHSITKLGPTGVAEEAFDLQHIQPWLRSLPNGYQPNFLGSLSPIELRAEIYDSWAGIVNPGGVPETFCVSAVDIQACNKTVYSVDSGALQETIYHGDFKSLATEKSPVALGNLIIHGLNNPQALADNNKLAGDFVRNKFASENIARCWLNLLSEENSELSIPILPNNFRDAISDIARLTNTSILINRLRKPEERKLYERFSQNIS